MKTELTNLSSLKEGDIFSFRTIKRPIWWRFESYSGSILIYEEIRSKFRHISMINDWCVLKKLIPTKIK